MKNVDVDSVPVSPKVSDEQTAALSHVESGNVVDDDEEAGAR